jgi:FdhD protein
MEDVKDLATFVYGLRLEGDGPGSWRKVLDPIALESPVNIYINSDHFVTLFATPSHLIELGYGHLLGEGVIESIDDVKSMVVEGTDIITEVARDDISSRISSSRKMKIITSSCGSVEDYLEALNKMASLRVTSEKKVDASKLRQLIGLSAKVSKGFRNSIAVHTAFLYSIDKDEVKYVAEDVSRHVTVDKVIGMAALDRADFGDLILFTTGRQASDMVFKAARVGIPITVSLRGPLYSGVYTAFKTGITLVAITRGKGLTVYTHPERIMLSSQS